MAATKTLKRSELYELVWQQPMARLAQTFAISDVGLAKICRKHDIPRPPRGYWAKKQFGQEPPKSPLPHSEKDNEIEMRDGSEAEIRDQGARAELDRRVAAERSNELRIQVAETLRGAHELVSQTNQELQSVRTDEYGIIIRPEKVTLDVTTSKATLRRALLIMNALLKALEQRGYLTKGDGIDVLKRLLRKGANPNDQANGGCSAIQSCLNQMGWARHFNSYSWERDANGRNLDTSESRDQLKAIHLLARHGAKWIPEDKYGLNSARKSLLYLKPEYTVEFVWIMAKYRACDRESVEALLRTPTMKAHTTAHRAKLSELVASWAEPASAG